MKERIHLNYAQGLYNPANDHDACGVGLVVNFHGGKSHVIVESALKVLEKKLYKKVNINPRKIIRKYCRQRFFPHKMPYDDAVHRIISQLKQISQNKRHSEIHKNRHDFPGCQIFCHLIPLLR